MATVKTGPDSIRVYLTGDPDGTSWTHDGSIGGSRLPVEVGQGFLVFNPIPGIYIELVALTVEGTAYLRADAGTLYFKAPTDSDFGTGVALIEGAAAIIYSTTTTLGYIRVLNLYGGDSYSGLATLTILNETNNAIGMSSGLKTGETAYRGLMIRNESASIITVSATAGPFSPHPFYVGFETPDANQKIQRIANEHTEPAGITWRELSPAASSGALQPGALAGLWLKRVIAACADPVPSLLRYCALSWTLSGAQTRRLSGRTRILNAAGSYELFKGEDALPAFGSPPATSGASLPLSVVVAPPGAGLTKTVYLATRKTNTGGLQSRNQYAHPFIIDDTGALVTEALHAPSNVAATVLENGLVRVTATYQGGYDDDPATHFYAWITTDGTAPDPDDAETYSIGMIPNGLSDSNFLLYVPGPYAHATIFKVLVRSYRSGDTTFSENTTPVTATITKAALRGIEEPQSWDDDLLAEVSASLGMPYGSLVESLRGNINWQFVRGQVRLYFDAVCAFVITDCEFRTMWTLTTGTVAGAASKNGVEVVDANTAYLAINGTRVMKLDLAALEITALQPSPGTIAYNSFESGPIYVTTDRVYFQNFVGGIWRTVATLSAAGDLVCETIRTCATSAELLG